MKKDPAEKLTTIGIVLVVMMAIAILWLHFLVQSVETMDAHSKDHRVALEDKLSRQEEAINKLADEVRRQWTSRPPGSTRALNATGNRSTAFAT